MLLHVRRVIILDPEGRAPQRGACVFSTTLRWPNMAGMVEGRSRPGTVERYGNVLATNCPDEIIEEIENGFQQYHVEICEKCSTLDECDEYETQAEVAAEKLLLLSGAWMGKRWAWVAPQAILDLSRVLKDQDRSSELQELIAGPRREAGFSLEGLRSFFLGVIEDESKNLRELAKGAKKRLRKRVKASVGAAAAAVAEEAFDAATDVGAQKLRDAFRQTSGRVRSYVEPKPVQADPLQQAEILLDLKWPYTKEDLEVSYRIQARKHHPDIAGAAGTEKMSQINIARDRIKQAREW